jgi:hypothetical protein
MVRNVKGGVNYAAYAVMVVYPDEATLWGSGGRRVALAREGSAPGCG